MKHYVTISMLSLFLVCNAVAQDSKSLVFKKGEILDVILLTGSPDFKALFKKYKETAFPVAFEYSYAPQSGFRAKELTLGNYLPSTFTFGKWESKKKREGFLNTISKRVPDFHQQRRNVFSYFGLVYYEIPYDMNVTFQKSDYHVVTSLWKNDSEDFDSFLDTFKANIRKYRGKIKLTLENGISPLGYVYNPELIIITAWKDKAAFEKFSKQYQLSAFKQLENVHQFVIE